MVNIGQNGQTWSNLVKIGQNWSKVARMSKKCSKLVQMNQNWSKLVRIGQSLSELVKISQQMKWFMNVFLSIYSLGDRFSMNTFDVYMIITLFYQFVTPLGYMIFAYTRMSIKLWHNQVPGNGDDDRDQQLIINKKKSIKMMVTVIVIFGVCWLPWHIFTILKLSWPALSK